MDLTTWALLVTWAVVIPYLVLFPPAIGGVRRKLKAAKEKRAIRRHTLKPAWQVKPAAGAAAVVAAGGVSLPAWRIPQRSAAVLVLVNPKSGGRLGEDVLRVARRQLGTSQVFDLSETPDVGAILQSFTGDVRLLVAGGDGTAAWVMEAAGKCGARMPLAMLPLGTGNDLARSFGWGGGTAIGEMSEEAIREGIAATAAASAIGLDRWVITTTPRGGGAPTRKVMNNYFSYGVDAEISLKFHNEREAHPDRFSSQAKNVVKYAMYGFQASFDGKPLDDCCRLETGAGQPLRVHPSWKGCIISNVPVYHGGKDFWGTADGDDFGRASVSDGQLEVMGLAGTLHIGMCNLMCDSALRIGQSDEIVVHVDREVAMQVDGEPFMQPPATMRFQLLERYPMLVKRGAAREGAMLL
jgi:diacylglycerol kinase (ATP)